MHRGGRVVFLASIALNVILFFYERVDLVAHWSRVPGIYFQGQTFGSVVVWKERSINRSDEMERTEEAQQKGKTKPWHRPLAVELVRKNLGDTLYVVLVRFHQRQTSSRQICRHGRWTADDLRSVCNVVVYIVLIMNRYVVHVTPCHICVARMSRNVAGYELPSYFPTYFPISNVFSNNVYAAHTKM